MATVYTQSGEEKVTDFTTGDDTAPSDYYIGWGSGSGTASKSDTSLFQEETESRQTATESQVSTDAARWTGTITADSAKTIREAGLFDSLTTGASSGTLYVHGDFNATHLESGDKIDFTIDLEQT